jgi:hypothetical protein
VDDTPAHQLTLVWRNDGHEATLEADLAASTFTITARDEAGDDAVSISSSDDRRATTR